MRLADERAWPAAMGIAAYQIESSGAAPASRPAELCRDELEAWLCNAATPAPSPDDLAAAFGLSFDAPEGEVRDVPPSHRLRFLLAVLRDAFPTDGAVRRWLRSTDVGRGTQRPLDLLRAGHVEQLEQLAVREWNRHRPTTYARPDARACAEPPAAGYDGRPADS